MLTSPSGIKGLDAVLRGGFPVGRTTIVIGSPGSGKTVLAMQYLVNGVAMFDEPSLMISFEESPASLRANFATMSRAVKDDPGERFQLVDGRLPEDALDAGAFDLGGLIAVASAIIAKHGIKRMAIDGIDALFALSERPSNRRREILRVLNWLADIKLTTLLTIKRSNEGTEIPGHFGLAEYTADGVIEMQKTMFGELARRTLNIVKLRGAAYDGGAHSYTISDGGIQVLHFPLRTRTAHQDLERRCSSGVERLDTMLLGGYRVGTTTLISGLPGTSKTTLGAAFLQAACRDGERCLFIGFDEPAEQMLVDVHSVGIDLDGAVKSGLLRVESFAAGSRIADEHFLSIESLIEAHDPKRVVIDPISALQKAGGQEIADTTMENLIGMFKARGMTAVVTAASESQLGEMENTPTRVSTVADSWIHLSFANLGGERNRTLTIVKARGTGHSNQMREVLLSAKGIDLADVFSAGGRVLVGTARAQRKEKEAVETAARDESAARELERLDREAQSFNRQLDEAQRGLDQLADYRAQLLSRTAASGRAHERETDLTYSLRHGDNPS